MKHRITLEADPTTIRSMLKAMRGNCEPIGVKMANILLTGEVPFQERVGLECYGVSVVAVEKMTEAK